MTRAPNAQTRALARHVLRQRLLAAIGAVAVHRALCRLKLVSREVA